MNENEVHTCTVSDDDAKCFNIASKDCLQLKHIWKIFSHTMYWETRTCGVCESCKWIDFVEKNYAND